MRSAHRRLALALLAPVSLLPFSIDPVPHAALVPLAAPPAVDAAPVLGPAVSVSVSRPVALRPACQVVLDAAIAAGWEHAHLPHLERLAWRESRCTTNAVGRNRNGTTDRGLLQLNDVNVELLRSRGVIQRTDELFDPATNLRAARVVFELTGTFCPWQAPHYC